MTLAFTPRMAGTVHRLDVVLSPLVPIRVEVRTQAGEPIPGMRLTNNGGGYTHSSGLATQIYRFNRKAIEVAATDAEGNATVRLLKVANQSYDISIGWRAAQRFGSSVSTVRVRSDSYPESICVEVAR